ncbi:MAG: PQQ-like beta-propeller repeat protein [Candidatus Hydrogenedentes bacterium]|nr:PQQ-like beta-propeller repeat protein [Candidatus Hydrogenedentota bacterium]
MAVLRVLSYFCLGSIALAGAGSAQENWPQWRGPDGNGVSTATGLPVTWSETENINWKTPLPSWSGSTPIVWGDKVFVVSPSETTNNAEASGRGRFSDPGGDTLLLLCLAKGDGKILWERELDKGNTIGRKGNSTSPSPVTDGTHIWAVTGTGSVTALSMDGTVVWSKNIQKEFGPFGLNFGYGSSPVLHDGKLFAQVLHGYRTDDPSYAVAFDALTGKLLWRVERPTDALSETPDAYNTPALLKVGGNTQLVLCGGGFVSAHDPIDGKEIWRASGLDPDRNEYYRTIASAVAVDGMVYAPTRQRPLLAVRGDGIGDVTTSHLAWKWDQPYGTDVPTPACDGKFFYMVDDKGVATCIDAKSGAIIWGPEHTVRGPFSASPVLADGKLYATNEAGVTVVLSAGREFKILATNTLPGEDHTLSSLAVSGSQLFLRTPSYLYCIGKN